MNDLKTWCDICRRRCVRRWRFVDVDGHRSAAGSDEVLDSDVVNGVGTIGSD